MIGQGPAAAPEGILARVPKTSGRPTREERIYKRLSELCMSLPGTTEKISWGPRFFPTPYSGGKGWVSLRMEGRTSWLLVKELCRRAHALVTEPARPSTRKRRD